MNAQVQNNRQPNPVTAFNAFLQKHKGQLELALPKHLNSDRMVRLTLTEFSKNPALQKCDVKSIFGSLITASQLGLEIGVNGQGYLIPYKNKCTFVPGWKGLVDLAQRGGRSSVWTGAVYEGDDFDYMLGDTPYCKHRPDGEFDVNKLTHVYAIGRVKDTEMPVIEVWTVKRVEAHLKKNNKVGNAHYALADGRKNFEMYARKVALLQVLKYMPQSIELSNALEVSNAAEQGKGVTIDGEFVTVDNTPQDDQQPANDQNATQNNEDSFDQGQQQIQQVQVDEDVISAPTFAQIRHGILTAKSPAHLDAMEDQAMDHANKDERKQLMTLVKAQAQKFSAPAEATVKKPDIQAGDVDSFTQPKTRTRQTKAVEVKQQPANDQNATSNDVAKETPENVIATSTDLKKVYIKQINAAEDAQQMKQIRSAVESEPKLTDGHKSYLIEHIKNSMSKFENAEDEQSGEDGPNVLNSQYTAKTLKLSIDKAQNIPSLEKIGQEIRESKPKLTQDDLNAVLDTYAKRKTYLESQISMFDVSFVDAAIARINEANTQDEINVEFLDPAYEELSDAEKQQINDAAQQRESELQQ